MSLKINHLKVSITVNQAKSEGGEGSSTPVSEQDAGKKADPEKLAKDVVEQVMRIMEDKKER
ncbi:hypothetical protein FK220_001645 [Flavobacteriaceae bacterium TP-CH-4]|uniref:Uncharacterized protein n=1 Tax=Pelagihabitans pacificus TaxID=2696054 RepID=A0A967AR81_9FLAO|nr:DUF5908 family protein [Pelagihabitans pacificus]NHF58025.1 hypothetical protein [Pelagihabitans pacificus]